jgi:hypothetical protein
LEVNSLWDDLISESKFRLSEVWGGSMRKLLVWLMCLGLLLGIIPPVSIMAAEATFGLNSGDSTNLNSTWLNAQRFANTAGTGMLTKLELLLNGEFSGQVRMGVYADSAGSIGALILDAGTVTPSANGWVAIGNLNLAVTVNTYYWLAFQTQGLDAMYQSTGQPTNCHAMMYQNFGPLPASLSAPLLNSTPFVMRATVNITAVPPVVTTSSATNIIATGVTLNGTLISSGSASNIGVGVYFQWGTASGSYPNSTAARQLTAAGAFSANLTGLISNTTYYYRAAASNSFIPYGSEMKFTTSNLNAAPTIEWNQSFGGAGNEVGLSIIQAKDGGYVVAGFTNSFGAGNNDAWLIKTDANGNKLWDKTYGGSGDDQAYSVIQVQDGGYVITGYTTSFGAGGKDIWLIKTDTNGNKIWDKTFGGAADDSAKSVIQTADGSYIIYGHTNLYGVDHDLWLIKTDSNGNLQWQQKSGGTYIYTRIESGNPILQTADDGYTYVCEARGVNGYIIWLVKTDTNGNKQWQNFGIKSSFEASDWGNSVLLETDSGYTIAGTAATYSPLTTSNIWLIKTDNNGNQQWGKTFGCGCQDYVNAAIHDNDGGNVIAGTTGSGAILLKTDDNGSEQWDKTFSGTPYSVIQTTNGGYVLTGSTSTSSSNGHVLLMKVAAEANIFGLNTGDTTLNGTSQLNIQRFQNTAGTGALSKLEVLIANSPSGKIRLGVYADNNGSPGNLLLDAGEVTATNGWTGISGLSLQVTANTYYWLAFLPENPMDIIYQSTGQPSSCHMNHPQSYGPLSGNFGSGDINNTPYVMRATVLMATTP